MNSFDTVICQEIIEHLENPWKLFRDAQTALKEGGILIISTPNIVSTIGKIRFWLTNYFQWFTPDCFSYHINPLPYWEISLIAEKTGFELLKLGGNGDYNFNRPNVKRSKLLRKNEELIFTFKKI